MNQVDKEPQRIAAMFDRVAPGYDRTNTVLSMGMDRYWRAATRNALNLKHGELCLDLAAGTGVSTEELARSGAQVIGCDFSLGMLRAGSHRGVWLVAGDAQSLPFATASFDAATIAFGLRNVADPEQGLREMARVTKPGGRLVVCEFSSPTLTPMRWGHQFYLTKVLPRLARFTSSDPAAYQYLAASIQEWPDQAGLAAMLGRAGWRQVAWRNLSGGVVALHRAVRG